MRIILFFLFSILTSVTIYGQDITGQWNGLLKVQGMQLRLVFNVSKTDDGYTSTMDSPDQGAKDIPVTVTIFEDPNITFEIKNAGIEYKGKLNGDKISGTFKQGGQEFSMDLSRDSIKKVEVNRPQEPTEPFLYYSEDVTFKNPKAEISLAGTLTLPKKKGKYPVVVLIEMRSFWDTNHF